MIKTLTELSKTSIKYKDDYASYSKELNSYLIKLINYNDIRDIRYTYDVLNNVTSKQDSKQNISQNYEFDKLNRITTANTQIEENPIETITYQYNSIGNITHKSDVGDYTYLKALMLGITL
jgi:hypothetical protein